MLGGLKVFQKSQRLLRDPSNFSRDSRNFWDASAVFGRSPTLFRGPWSSCEVSWPFPLFCGLPNPTKSFETNKISVFWKRLEWQVFSLFSISCIVDQVALEVHSKSPIVWDVNIRSWGCTVNALDGKSGSSTFAMLYSMLFRAAVRMKRIIPKPKVNHPETFCVLLFQTNVFTATNID